MDPFAAALDALFVAPGSAAAVYVPEGGPAAPIRVIRSRPDMLGPELTVQGSNVLELRRSEVSAPRDGDIVAIGADLVDGVAIGGEWLELLGEPMGDAEGLTWRMGAAPYSA